MSSQLVTRCLHCGADFIARAAVVAEGGGKFCSAQCNGAARSSQADKHWSERLERRFYDSIDIYGPVLARNLGRCHLWLGARDSHGYGQLRIVDGISRGRGVRGRLVKAHRVAFLLHHGRWPEPCALHECDGGPIGCVRWEHLVEGTQGRNMADMIARGRAKHGERHPAAKLTDADVAEIRRMLATGLHLQHDIAALFGVRPNTISRIGSGTRRVASVI